MGRARIAVIAGLAAALVGSLVGAPTATATTQPVEPAAGLLPGEVVLPPLYGADLPNVTTVSIGDTGVLWRKDGGALRYVPAPGQPSVPTPPRGALTGKYAYWGPSNNGVQFPSVAYDMTTGVQTQLRANYTPYEAFLIGTGDGWLDVIRDQTFGSPTRVVHTDMATRVSTDLGRPQLPNNPDGFLWVSPVTHDEQGAVLGLIGRDSSQRFLYYVHFDTGTWTMLRDDDYPSGVALGTTWIAWRDDSGTHIAPRTDLGSRVRTMNNGTSPIRSFLFDGDTLAVLRETTATSKKYVVSIVDPEGDTVSIPTSDGLRPPIRKGPGGGFSMTGGSTPETYGLYTFDSSAATMDNPFVLFGAAPPLGIEASAGRLLAVRETRPLMAVERYVSHQSATALTVHSSTTLASSYPGEAPPDPTGGHSSYVKWEGTDAYIVVLDGKTVVHKLPIAPGGGLVEQSGRWAVAPSYDDAKDRYTFRLYDLRSGTWTPILGGNPTISGDHVVYLNPAGDILRRHVATGETEQIRPAGPPEGGEGKPQLRAFGDWVVATWNNGDPYTAMSEAYEVSSQTWRPLASETWPELADGIIAWINPADRVVKVQNLTTGAVATVGVSRPWASNRPYVALSSEFVAWVADDDTTHVLPLASIPAPEEPTPVDPATADRSSTFSPFAATEAPRFLGAQGSTIFTPNGDGKADAFRPRVDTSRPISAWTIQIRNPDGKLYRTLTGRAPKGNIRASWDGRTTSGLRAKAGTYTWTLTATGIGGSLRKADGSSGKISGAVRLVR